MKRRSFMQYFGLAVIGAQAFLEACAATALTWVQIGLSLIATLAPTIPGIIAAFAKLVGKTLTAAQQAKIAGYFTKVTDLLTQIQQQITAFEANPVSGTISIIKQLVTDLQSVLNLQTILADLNITDSATVQKITGIVNTILGIATDILGVLPALKITAQGGMTVNQGLVPPDIAKTLNPKIVAQKLNAALWATTGNTEVDAIFEQVKTVPVTVTVPKK